MKQLTLIIYVVSELFVQLLSCKKFQFELIDESFAKVYLGNPEQELKLFIDPSSLVSALFDQKCSGCGLRQNYSQASNTLSKSHILYSLKTIFGTYNGTIVNEQITFKDKAKLQMHFLLVSETDAIRVDFDGILGLGQPSAQLQAFSSLSFIYQLNKQHQVESIFTIEHNKFINFGKDDNNNNEVLSKSSAIEIIIKKTNMEYPTMNTNFKGISCFKKLDMSTNPKLFMDISGPVAFTLSYHNLMPHVIFPSQEYQYFRHYFNYLMKNTKQMNNKTEEGTNNLIIHYPGEYNLKEYVSALIIQNNFFKYTSSNETKLEQAGVLNLAFTNNSNYTFFTLNQLKSNSIVFDYTQNSLSLYNCNGCHFNEESSFWVFTSIFLLSGGAITLLLILLSFGVYNYTGDENRNLLKSYTIII